MIYKASIINFRDKKWVDWVVILILSLTLPLFFYKLGQSSLVSWDEAWYAEIARNILRSGDIFNLSFNGKSYYDHPPVGFWAMALSFSLFGVNEFTARLPSATFGFITLILVYLLGKKLFNRTVGFCASLSLSSAFWFIYRSRSGNLDITLTMFFVLTIYLAILAAERTKFLIPFLISLALLLQVKTGIPLVILPSLVIIFWKNKIYSIKKIYKPLMFFIILAGCWILVQIFNNPAYLERYIFIGLPDASIQSSYLDNFKTTKEYLHNGIGKWFWPSILSMLIGFLFLQKRFYILSVFCVLFLLPFLFSPRGGIWHLIPTYPFLLILFYGVVYIILEKFSLYFKKFLRFLFIIPIFIMAIYYSLLQIRQEWYQFIDIPKYISDEQILATEASYFPQKLLIDDNYFPTAVFYSQKVGVRKIYNGELENLFDGPDDFLLITSDWKINSGSIDKGKYRIIKADRDKVLLLKK